MSYSYLQTLVHCVYSTEGRRNLILPGLQQELWEFKSAIAKRDGIPVLAAGGIENHAHILIALPPEIALSKALQNIKAHSSRWMRKHVADFKWQKGYGAFSVSLSEKDTIKRYIANQAEYHQKISFEDEFLLLLKSARIEHDPRHVFG